MLAADRHASGLKISYASFFLITLYAHAGFLLAFLEICHALWEMSEV